MQQAHSFSSMSRVLSDNIPSIPNIACFMYLFQMQTVSSTRRSKRSHYVCRWNDKFRELLMLQITTVVDSNVAEYKFLQEVLLLNKWTILKVEQEGQENCQSVLTSPFPLWNLDSQ